MPNMEEVVQRAAIAVRERHPQLEIHISRRGPPSTQPADARMAAAFQAVFTQLGQATQVIALTVEGSTAGGLVTLVAGVAEPATWETVSRIVKEAGGRVAIRKNANGTTAFAFWDAGRPKPKKGLFGLL